MPKALLVFADDGHVLPSDFPRDIDPFAFANFRLSVVRRDIHDPASIRSPAGSLGGECGSGDGNYESRNEKISSHGEILLWDRVRAAD